MAQSNYPDNSASNQAYLYNNGFPSKSNIGQQTSSAMAAFAPHKNENHMINSTNQALMQHSRLPQRDKFTAQMPSNNLNIANGYNKWTSNTDESESLDITEIDGGIMEGGGQILRIAVALSAILHKPISVNNIRANRTNPGLRPQHLAGMQLVRDLCYGQLSGDQVGSQHITFIPGMLQSGTYLAETGTAGAVSLLLQVRLWCVVCY